LPLGSQIAEKRSEFEAVSRYTENTLVFKKGTSIFNERVGYADPDFLNIFSYPLKYGQKEAFLDPGNLFISSEVAERFFGDMDPTGELITVILEDGSKNTMKVGAVMEKIPQNTSMRMSAITLWDNYLKFNDTNDNNWKSFIAGTFIKLKENSNVAELEKWLNSNYIDVQNKARDDWKVANYDIVSLDAFSDMAENLRSQWLNEPPPKPAIVAPFIMAILLLLIACFNFTNTAIAISSKRLKEIGIRKVMGGTRKQLIYQFMGENLVLTLISLLVGVGIAFFLVPVYSAMWDFIDLKLDFLTNPEILLYLFALLLFTSIIAGIYPSLYISGFQPVSILKGTVKIKATSLFSKILLSSQFAFTIIGMVASIAFTRNAMYQSTLDVGYRSEDIFSIYFEDPSEYEKMKGRMEQMPGIVKVAGTEHDIGSWTYGRTLESESKKLEANMMNFGLDYIHMMELKLKSGRLWTKDLEEFDKENSIIVNETLVNEFGWEDPIGKIVQIDDSSKLSIVGVIEDIHIWGFWDKVEPLGIRISDREQYNFIVAQTEEGKVLPMQDEMENLWYDVVPDKPFNSWTKDSYLEDSELVNANITKMFGFIGALAFILSLIGMFTLVSLSVIKRIKEIGIRKVMGAAISQIIILINIPFFWILGIAISTGVVLSYLAIDALMGSVFAYYKAIDALSIGIPVVLMISIAFSISSTRIGMAAVQNPVKSLRYE